MHLWSTLRPWRRQMIAFGRSPVFSARKSECAEIMGLAAPTYVKIDPRADVHDSAFTKTIIGTARWKAGQYYVIQQTFSRGEQKSVSLSLVFGTRRLVWWWQWLFVFKLLRMSLVWCRQQLCWLDGNPDFVFLWWDDVIHSGFYRSAGAGFVPFR